MTKSKEQPRKSAGANTAQNKPFLEALSGRKSAKPPLWLMRQAGRYLPEYREMRAKAGGFLDLVYNPALATEVTLQPIRRYGFDAAILFSDILVVPQALGIDLRFAEGEGPVLSPVRDAAGLKKLSRSRFDETLAPILETIGRIRDRLAAENFRDTALIGFAGAPWTLACYIAEGGGSRDFIHVKSWAYRDPDNFAALIDLLTDATMDYLAKQIEAGAEAVQMFDSWAGVLDEQSFRRWVMAPAQKIAKALRGRFPQVPLIGFPRGAGALYEAYARESGVTALGLDQHVPLRWAAKTLQQKMPVQGSLDPVCLLTGGDALQRQTEEILAAFSDGPFIFNLGHGIHKDTPPDHVAQLVKLVRG